MTAHPLTLLPKVTDFDVEDNQKLIDIIVEQERIARFQTFDHELAYTLGETIRNLYYERYGSRKNVGAIIKIELWSGMTLFSAVVGTAPFVSADNWVWANGKSNVVKQLSKSSLRVGREFSLAGRKPEDKGLSFPDFACHGGGFPLFIHGVDTGPIGSILVSGLPQLEDHQLIVDSIAKLQQSLGQVTSKQ